MKKRLFTTLALVCCTVLVSLAVIADLNGKWSGSVQTPNGDYPVNFTFKVDGDKLTGTAGVDAGAIPLTDGKVNGANFSFGMDFNGVPLKNTGKFYGDSITIDVDYQGTIMHGVCKRVADKK